MAKSKEQGRKPKSKKKNKVVQDGGVHKPKEIKTNLKHVSTRNAEIQRFWITHIFHQLPSNKILKF